MNKIKVNFESENLIVDWISLNITNFRDSKVIGDRLFPYFNISITMNNQSRIRFFDQRNIYNVSIREQSKGYWNGDSLKSRNLKSMLIG